MTRTTDGKPTAQLDLFENSPQDDTNNDMDIRKKTTSETNSPMKDSGVEWIGEIPITWDCMTLKYLIARNDSGVWGDDPKGSHEKLSTVFRSTEQTLDGHWNIKTPALRNLTNVPNRYNSLLKPGDLLITKSSGSFLHIGKTTLFNETTYSGEVFYSNFMQRIRLYSSANPKFFWYVFNSPIIRAQFEYGSTTTIGINNLNAAIIGNLQVPVPPLAEQVAIASRLDSITSRIDESVRLIDEQLADLKDYRKALISEVVTRGVPSDSTPQPTKPTNTKWIPTIPTHWKTQRLRRIAFVFSGKTPVYTDGENNCPIAGQRNNQEGHFDISGMKYGTPDFYSKQPIAERLMSNDVMLNSLGGGSVGRVGIFDGVPQKYLTDGHVIIIRGLSKYVLSRYIGYFLMTKRADLENLSVGSTNQCFLKINDILDLRVPVPPLAEQDAIVAYLDEMTGRISDLENNLSTQRDELLAYRQSVINEYVTGKKRVS